MFIDRLIKRIEALENPTVAGLDPVLEYLPRSIQTKSVEKYGKTFRAARHAITEFNVSVIDALYDIVPMIKPQLAYYEMYGLEGMAAFYDTVAHARSKGMLVLCDAKRNDIGSTARAYSNAFLGRTELFGRKCPVVDSDALTVNPYLGSDGLMPFVEDCLTYEKGLFILIKTSNPSSGQLQDLKTDQGLLYEQVAKLTARLGAQAIGAYGYSSIGAVVGATYAQQAKKIRAMLANAYILIPGYGAQGATAKDCMASFDKDGLGGLINASRSLVFSYRNNESKTCDADDDYVSIIRSEALRMKQEIKTALGGS